MVCSRSGAYSCPSPLLRTTLGVAVGVAGALLCGLLCAPLCVALGVVLCARAAGEAAKANAASAKRQAKAVRLRFLNIMLLQITVENFQTVRARSAAN